MLRLARNIVLERAFLLQLNCSIPKPMFDDKGKLLVSESPFLINRNILNRQTLVMSKVIMKKGIAPAFQMNTAPTPVGGVTPGFAAAANMNTSQHLNPQGGFSRLDIAAANEEVSMNQHLDQVSPQVLQMARAADQQQQKVNENFVKTKIDSMCGCPKKEKMTFYTKDSDETFGKFLYRISKLHMNQCEHCREHMFKHFIQYYHKDGCLEIQLEMKQIV